MNTSLSLQKGKSLRELTIRAIKSISVGWGTWYVVSGHIVGARTETPESNQEVIDSNIHAEGPRKILHTVSSKAVRKLALSIALSENPASYMNLESKFIPSRWTGSPR